MNELALPLFFKLFFGFSFPFLNSDWLWSFMISKVMELLILDNSNNDTLPNECYLTPNSGSCFGYVPMYYFDSSTNSCEQFIWGGCAGVVPFQSLSECQEACE